MGLLDNKLPHNPALQQSKQALIVRLRQNFLLKVIALIVAVLLHFLVQTERNPVQTRSFSVRLARINPPSDMEVELDTQQVDVTLTGPRLTLERIKESSLQAVVDLKDLIADEGKAQSVKVRSELVGLSPSMQNELSVETLPQRVKAQVFLPSVRFLAVTPLYPKELPEGLRYERPIIQPERVKIMGRGERVNKVDRVIILAEAPENGARIQGDYTPQARDKSNNAVEGVTIVPNTVRLTIPVAEEPSVKVVPISPDIPDVPLPPYALNDIRALPKTVRVVGRPERLAQIFTIETETIAIRDFSETQEVTANLIIPPDVQIRDAEGRPVTQVKVRIGIRKLGTTPLPSSPSGTNANPGGTPPETKPENAPRTPGG